MIPMSEVKAELERIQRIESCCKMLIAYQLLAFRILHDMPSAKVDPDTGRYRISA